MRSKADEKRARADQCRAEGSARQARRAEVIATMQNSRETIRRLVEMGGPTAFYGERGTVAVMVGPFTISVEQSALAADPGLAQRFKQLGELAAPRA